MFNRITFFVIQNESNTYLYVGIRSRFKKVNENWFLSDNGCMLLKPNYIYDPVILLFSLSFVKRTL